jgi:hypothetical protein
VTQGITKYQLRMERHPGDPDAKADVGEHDAERQAAAAAARTLLPHIDVPAVRRAFEQTLSPAERRHLDQLRRRYGNTP